MHESTPHHTPWWKKLLQFILFLAIVGGGAMGARYFIKTAPKPERKAPVKQSAVVETMPVTRGTTRVAIKAMGTVLPARELAFKARVSGEVVSLSPGFVPGGVFAKGAELLRIDPADYRLDVRTRQAELASAEADLALEQGQQNVARKEWKLLRSGSKQDAGSELALRVPQLKQAQAARDKAAVALKQSSLDLARTTLTTPFNAMVSDRSVELGAVVTTQETLATLVGTDEYWVQASLPVDRLEWITLPAPDGSITGSPVTVTSSAGESRTGSLLKLLSSLEADGRMARVLISIPDPLGLRDESDAALPLLLDDYVSVEIQGRELTDVVTIPRSTLKEGTHVWVASPEGTLDIRPVSVIWKDKMVACIDQGLSSGDHLIITDLAAPVQGMPVRSRSKAESEKQATGEKSERGAK